jgi:hypothetical protein
MKVTSLKMLRASEIYLLGLQNFVVDKIPDDGTLVAEHVGVGT